RKSSYARKAAKDLSLWITKIETLQQGFSVARKAVRQDKEYWILCCPNSDASSPGIGAASPRKRVEPNGADRNPRQDRSHQSECGRLLYLTSSRDDALRRTSDKKGTGKPA